MKYFILCVLFLVSCASNRRNDCVLDALNQEAVEQAKEGLDKTIWSRILLMHAENGQQHAMLVVRNARNVIFAYDRYGTVLVENVDINKPILIAREIVRLRKENIRIVEAIYK